MEEESKSVGHEMTFKRFGKGIEVPKPFVVWIHPESSNCGVWTREEFISYVGGPYYDGCVQEHSGHDTKKEAKKAMLKLAGDQKLSF